jgi:hypothetical protein
MVDDDLNKMLVTSNNLEKTIKNNHDSALELIEMRLKNELPDEYEKLQKLSGGDRTEFLEMSWSKMERPIDLQLIEEIKKTMYSILGQALPQDDFPKELMEYSQDVGFGDPSKLLVRVKLAQKETMHSTDEENAIKAMDAYKTIVEGPYKWYIRIIVYALIKNGKTDNLILIGRGNNRRIPKSLMETDQIDLGKMIEFLDKQGLNNFTNACNKTLRNASAHDKYQINKDGSISYWDRSHPPNTITLEELNEIIDDLIDLNYAMFEGLKFSLGRVYGP